MIIIDGHNLLHAIPKADRDSASINEIGLCRLLDKYLRLTGQAGEIIFDGAGPRDKSMFDNVSDIEVLFAGPGNDADTVIEDKIKASSAPKRLTIISSDRRLRKAARARKATVQKSEIFWIEVQRQLNRKRPIKEPGAKRNGLSEIETEQWLEFFGLKQ